MSNTRNQLIEYQPYYTYNAPRFWSSDILRETLGKGDGFIMGTISKPAVFRVCAHQLLLLMLGTVVALFADVNIGVSILLGGLTQWVPQAWFSYQAFKYTGASQADNILTSIYRGEAGKLMLTASGCVLTFVGFGEVNVLAFFGALIIMILIQIILVAKAVA